MNSTIPEKIPSLCIPRVHNNISESHIHSIFTKLKLGIIDRIDMVYKKEDKFKIVFVHFKKWFQEGNNATIARERLLNGQEIKVIYEGPWFWKISAYRESTQKEESKRYNNSKK